MDMTVSPAAPIDRSDSFLQMRRFCASFAATIALLVLIGWTFEIEVFKRMMPGLVAMNPTTAICLLLSAMALVLNASHGAARAAAAAVIALATAKLVEVSAGFPLRVDQLFFASSLDDAAGAPNRMAPNTAVALALLGLSLLTAMKSGRRTPLLSQLLAGLAACIALFALNGYLLGLGNLYGIARFIPMALHTAICIMVLAAGVFSAHPRRGLMKILLDRGPAGSLSRTILPLAVLAPVAVGFLRLMGQRAGFYGTETGVAVQVVANVILTSSLLLGIILPLYRTDRLRRLREVTVRRSSQALGDSATRQAAIFEAANDAMLILDERGVITSANHAAERLFGHRRVDMIGRSNLSLFADAPSEAVSLAYLRRIARADGSVDTTQTFVGARDDGTTFVTEVATTPVILHDGPHFLAVARDATERRRIERLKNEFVATISHELRTPLTSIAGSLGLLSGGAAGPLPDKATRLLGIAQSNSQRLIHLINDILDIEKIEAGKMVFSAQLLQLQPLLEQALHDSSGLADERNVTLTLAPVVEGSTIHADPDRMGQVLANLLSNAIKYSPVGGTVTVSTERQHPFQRISIADQGSGIPEEFRGRIFEKFAQADSTDTRGVGGTGLGLSIVREIINRMGGSVSFDSPPGDGSVFHIDLPAQTAESYEPIDTATLSPLSDSAARNLLHVDDDPDTLRLVATAFEGRFEVRSTPSVLEAEAALRRFRFNLVILDSAMADGSGTHLVPSVRASCGDCPIILYTAYDVEPGVAATVDAVRTKTLDGLDELVALGDRLARPAAATEQA